jgi:ABC-2 type transport system permease protein
VIHLIIYKLELAGSFYSWRGAIWIITVASIYSLVAYLLLTDKELSLLDQSEMLFTFSQIIIVLGLLMSAINSSSAISTEIEGGTFECLLLTPIKHNQIAIQKMLSTETIWIILYLISIHIL